MNRCINFTSLNFFSETRPFSNGILRALNKQTFPSKRDRRNTVMLARLHHAGNLICVFVPHAEDEAAMRMRMPITAFAAVETTLFNYV